MPPKFLLIHLLGAGLVALVFEMAPENQVVDGMIRLQANGFAVCRFCRGEIALLRPQVAEPMEAVSSTVELDSFLQHPLRPFQVVSLDQLARQRCEAGSAARRASGPFPKNFLGADRIAHVVEHVAESAVQLTEECGISVLREVLDTFPQSHLCPFKIISLDQHIR
jgi:hypothetical protein